MLINFDCSCLWVKDKFMLTKALSVDPIYLRYKEMDKAIDYRVSF
jgi:tyrosine decarboxylase